MNESNRAAYAVYRPEIRGMPMPKTYLEAKKKYNHGAQPQLTEHARHMKKLGITQKIVGYKKEGEHRNKSLGQDLNKYLGSRPLVKTSAIQEKNRRMNQSAMEMERVSKKKALDIVMRDIDIDLRHQKNSVN